MFKHILVAIDGSEYSRQAVPTAIEAAMSFGADVFVLHVREQPRGRAVVYPHETPDEARLLVDNAIKTVRAAGITVKGEVDDEFAGQAAKGIVAEAAAQGCDLICMGSRGLSDVAGAFLGSVTHAVLQHADTPVLITRTPAKAKVATAGAQGAAKA